MVDLKTSQRRIVSLPLNTTVKETAVLIKETSEANIIPNNEAQFTSEAHKDYMQKQITWLNEQIMLLQEQIVNERKRQEERYNRDIVRASFLNEQHNRALIDSYKLRLAHFDEMELLMEKKIRLKLAAVSRRIAYERKNENFQHLFDHEGLLASSLEEFFKKTMK